MEPSDVVVGFCLFSSMEIVCSGNADSWARGSGSRLSLFRLHLVPAYITEPVGRGIQADCAGQLDGVA